MMLVADIRSRKKGQNGKKTKLNILLEIRLMHVMACCAYATCTPTTMLQLQRCEDEREEISSNYGRERGYGLHCRLGTLDE